MKLKVKLASNRNETSFISTNKILVRIGDNEFEITANNEGYLVLNKSNCNALDDRAILIKPSVSNEIRVK
jgi:hypothetical protein